MDELRPDCSRCFGLCCVGPGFSASAWFAFDKPPGRPCPHLGPDFECKTHDSLRQQGLAGCATFDCFGAGQKVAQVTFGGLDWRRAPQTGPSMFAVFTIMRSLHELLVYLHQGVALAPDDNLRQALHEAIATTRGLTLGQAEEILALDLPAHWRAVNNLLNRTSIAIRSAEEGIGPELTGADLAGVDLTGRDLRRASLRGASLAHADLAGVDLSLADVTGADFRSANLARANLIETIFLTQAQVDEAHGDGATLLPPAMVRPAHWSPSDPVVTR